MLFKGRSYQAMICFLILIFSPGFLLGTLTSLKQKKIPEIKQIRLAGYPNAYNPSLVMTDHGLLLSFRYHPEPSKLWISNIGLVLLDEFMQPISKPEILKTRATGSLTPSQAEDARLFTHHNKIYIVYNDNIEVTNPNASQRRDIFIAEIDYVDDHFVFLEAKKLIYPEKLATRSWEKNWTPFVGDDTLYLIYSIDPFEVIRPDLETGICESAHLTFPKTNWKFGSLRGGTPALMVDGEYLAFFHCQGVISSEQKHGASTWLSPRVHYLMGAFTFTADPPFKITGITSAPIIEKGFYTMLNIEKKVIYPGGFVVNDSKIHIAYGRDDKEVWVITYDKDYIKSLLVPVH